MKNALIALIAVVSINAFAAEPKVWNDGNHIEWTMLEVKTTQGRATQRCKDLGYALPFADDFFEAIDLGILDAKKNTIFGEAAAKIDWIWTKASPAPSMIKPIASKWGDTSNDDVRARHWVLCAKAK